MAKLRPRVAKSGAAKSVGSLLGQGSRRITPQARVALAAKTTKKAAERDAAIETGVLEAVEKFGKAFEGLDPKDRKRRSAIARFLMRHGYVNLKYGGPIVKVMEKLEKAGEIILPEIDPREAGRARARAAAKKKKQKS